ncbi:undecaprenyl pyrophosphate synthetase family protein [Dorcoceras hygrometricum]|uniref:Undecaprenyl pyrophosphate synthetase family protein n=1 Tax=Dorcoceras hygrometricum TaxID=472368 RepID=A0A2Z7DB41_9LAMI|nr:undecaprenyl pyrophosphate synthetase family protein [Dorcoceras hygrometricum]
MKMKPSTESSRVSQPICVSYETDSETAEQPLETMTTTTSNIQASRAVFAPARQVRSKRQLVALISAIPGVVAKAIESATIPVGVAETTKLAAYFPKSQPQGPDMVIVDPARRASISRRSIGNTFLAKIDPVDKGKPY